MRDRRTTALAIGLVGLVAACSGEGERQTQEAASAPPSQTAASDIPANPNRNAYFGDLHLHTSMSFDAAASGTRTMPEDSYRYARGEEVEYFGQRVRRNAPLDFLAVTDHSEYMGIVNDASDPDGPYAGTDWPARLAAARGKALEVMRIFSPSAFRGNEGPIPEFVTDERIKSHWQMTIHAAQEFYEPGEFTTFVAYEWSPMPGGAHLHRNVIFKGPEFPDRPFSAIDSQRPEDLWTYAEANRAEGMDSLLIPHNSNLSEGLMFALRDSDGNPLTRAYAERRRSNERLVEITQNKGTSETRPEFAPTDEFADFELISWGATDESVDLAGGYVREGLKRGLVVQDETGANPFRLGFVGGSDFHSGVSSSEENNFPGGLGSTDAQTDPEQVLTENNPVMNVPVTVLSASGITGVWAERNTREDIFEALKRREVFATSGPRIQVRMFAGWRYEDGLTEGADWVGRAYAEGVPMGADLMPTAGDAAPRFLLSALKDPDSGNLDRIQVIKVWLEDGQAQETVFDAVWAGEREPDRDTGMLPPVGNSVDVETATYTNDIGAARLIGEWTDPEFEPGQAALYYARVLEIPTPRWSTYLAARNNLPPSDAVPPTLQERAWTSPIFYTPPEGSR